MAARAPRDHRNRPDRKVTRPVVIHPHTRRKSVAASHSPSISCALLQILCGGATRAPVLTRSAAAPHARASVKLVGLR